MKLLCHLGDDDTNSAQESPWSATSSNDTSYRNSNAVAVLVITILHEGSKSIKRTMTHLDGQHLEGADTL